MLTTPNGVPVIDPAQLEFRLRDPRRLPSIATQLRALVRASGLSLEDFAAWVVGCSARSLHRWLRGGRVPHDRRCWLLRIESATFQGDQVVIVVRRGARGTRWRFPKKSRKTP